MIKNRISKTTKQHFQNTIRDVIKGLSRSVLVYRQSIKQDCTNCYYDKLTTSSTNKCKWTPVEALSRQSDWEALGNATIRYKYFAVGRCPVCKGVGQLETLRRRTINCLVVWNPRTGGGNNDIVYTPAGTEGSTIVMLKTDPKYFDLFKNCSKIVVDGVECKLSRPPLLRGLGNQSVLIIMAFTTEKPTIDSGEIVKDYS